MSRLELVAMLDAGWNSTQHHCLRGDYEHHTPHYNTNSRVWTLAKPNLLSGEACQRTQLVIDLWSTHYGVPSVISSNKMNETV